MTRTSPIHTGSKSRRRWPWISILVLLGLVAAARLILTTGIAHRWVRARIIQSAGERLDAGLEIEAVSGDLLREITLVNVRLVRMQDTVFQVDTLHAAYNAWSYFQSEFQVSRFQAVHPRLKILQDDDGNWNLASLRKQGRPEPAENGSPFLFDIAGFTVRGGEIEGRINALAPDSQLVIREMNMGGGFGYYGENYRLRLEELGFRIDQAGLDSPVSVESSLEATGQGVTLEKLIVATGTSMLESSGAYHRADSSGTANLSARPLSLNDLSAYVEGMPVKRNLQFNLNLEGNPEAFTVTLEAEADGVDALRLSTGFRWDEDLVLKDIELRAGRLDLGSFMDDSSYPLLNNPHVSGNGELRLGDPKQAVMSGVFSTSSAVRGAYGIDRLEGRYSVENGTLSADARAERGSETVEARLEASAIWNSQPVFTLNASGSNLDPSYWLGEPGAAGSVQVTAKLAGAGYRPGDRYWDYELDMGESSIAGQQFTEASVNGKWNRRRITARSRVQLRSSRMELQAEVNNYGSRPEYRFDAAFYGLNLAECRGLEDFATAINGRVRGEGRYISPESMQLTSSMTIDSSIVNREFIEELSADIAVRDTVAHLTDARLRSDIADGRFDARIHLLNLYDIANRLHFDMQVKDVQSLAPLFGAEQLQAFGAIKGTLNPVYEEQLQFSGTVDFSDVVYGDRLTSGRVNGDVNVLLVEDPEYLMVLNLEEPVINSVVLQDLSATVRGKAAADSTYGDYQLMFRSPADSRIQLTGSYHLGRDTTRVRTIDLRVISDLRSLSLVQPFDITVTGGGFRMDTLRLDSDDGASLEMAIPYADSLDQSGYLEGRNLNMTVIQNALLNEAYFEGILSGRIYLERHGTEISSSGDIYLRDLDYQGVKMDSLLVRYELSDERLEGGLLLYDRKERLAEGQLRVPFRLGDPDTFGSSFFEEAVFGYLRVNRVAVNRFDNMLDPAGITGTDGLFRFNANLRGTAGEPEINAAFRLTDATVSGVAVDSVNAALNYHHGERMLTVNGSVMYLRQKAAEIAARVPIFVDLKSFAVELPDGEDRIQVNITTDAFNLASLNDFVDRSRFSEIRGRLDGVVTVSGQLNDLSTSGQLHFREGTLRIVEAGIKVERARSKIVFDKNRIHLEELRARSGNGTFRADGSLELHQLRPGDIDVRMIAENFRIANTPDYRAVINMNSRLEGTFFQPHMKGTLNFISGYIYLQNFGERSVEAVRLESAAAPEFDYYVQYDSLSLDMDVSFNRRFFVRNRRFLDLEYELQGQMDLLKEKGRDVQLFGTLSAVEGYARPLGKRFELEEGVITFAGDPTNPGMNIRHQFAPPQQRLGDVRIWYVIEGTVEDPQFKYESEPPMGLEDIISYTLFGKPFMSLDPWKQVVASSGSNVSAANVAMDVLLDKVETLATQRLGIDVVQIDNTRSGGSDNGTSIKTGWYLNPKVFFAIQKEIAGTNPDTIFILEYLLQKNVKLIITQGSNSQTGVDLKWNYDY